MQESPTLEFKGELTDSFLKTVSAFSNYRDGTILFGANDEGETTGLDDVNAAALKIEQKINDSISPVPLFQLEVDEEARTIAVHVSQGISTPYLYKGVAYKRVHTSSRPVDQLELQRLSIAGQNTSYDDIPSPEQVLAFSVLGAAFQDKAGVESISKDVLRTLRLLRPDGRFTHAAELLADSNQYTGIAWQRIDGRRDGVREHGDLSRRSILQQLDEISQIFTRYYSSELPDQPVGRSEVWDVPPAAFREAVANALVHRAWDIPAPITVSLRDDAITIVSMGGLPSTLTTEEYLNSEITVPRNPVLADIFYRLGIIERFGTGARRIREAYAGHVQQPTFQVTENAISITLPVILDSAQDEQSDELLILEQLRRGGPLSRQSLQDSTRLSRSRVLAAVRSLQENGAIARHGAGPATKYKVL